MKRGDFLSISKIEDNVENRMIDPTGEKIDWFKARMIKIEKDKPFSIFFKTDHKDEDNWQELDIKKAKKGRPSDQWLTDLDISFPKGKEISNAKLADIKFLLNFVPEDAREFYQNLVPGIFEDEIEGY